MSYKTLISPDTASSLGAPMMGHNCWVRALAYSPDGRSIVSGALDGSICTWSSSGVELLKNDTAHRSNIISVSFSPCGREFLSCASGCIVKWDSRTGEEITKIAVGGISQALYSPDGRFIVGGFDDGKLRRFDASTGKLVGNPLKGHTNDVRDIVISPDGRLAFTTSWDKTLRSWDLHLGLQVGPPWAGLKTEVGAIALSPDGMELAVSWRDNTIQRWNVNTRETVGAPLVGHTNYIRTMAYSPDGKELVSAGDDLVIRRWNVDSGLQECPGIRGHEGVITGVSFSPDGREIASCSCDSTLRRWRGRSMEKSMQTYASAPCLYFDL